MGQLVNAKVEYLKSY